MDSRTAFSDSNDFSNASSTSCLNLSVAINAQHRHHSNSTENFATPDASAPPDIAALVRLSDNLDSIFESENVDFYADAKIAVGAGKEIPVHRCILASRSPYLKAAFASHKEREREQQREKGSKGCGGVRFELKDLARDYDVGFDALVTVLAYLYSGKVKPLPKDICVCVDDECPHLGCRPVVEFMAEVLYLSFTFQIAELVSLYQRRLLEILEKITPDDLLIVLSVADLCKSACERLHMQCVEIVVKSDVDNIALEKLLPMHIANVIMNERKELAQIRLDCNGFPDKHVKRIHRALDSDDVELVMMLLKEGHTTLDDAYALHYAVAYCDVKTASELLELGLADVNGKNERGFSVLHVAAMRKEPKIIISLLTKGARPTEVTSDRRKALQISKRLTKAADWFKLPEEGKSSHKDRLCIEILEQAERREPLFLGEGCVSLARASEDTRSRLLYLESRVGLARYLFPEEAKVAMEIAHVDGTTEFTLPKETVDLNEAPFIINEEHSQRMKALENTVGLGKHFFPRCSKVIDKIMDADDLTELANMTNDTPEEQMMKKRRYMELQEELSKAFIEDKKDKSRSTLSSCSSSTPMGKHPKLSYKR
ncbi:hypothetical protein V2J09_012362 [Rumex salicifolius]